MQLTTMPEKKTVQQLSMRRFDALAGYARSPRILQLVREIEWLETADERVLGVVTVDRIDHDYGWVALGRDEKLRFRAINVNASLPDANAARAQLVAEMEKQANAPDTAFHQGDSDGLPVDFFKVLRADNRIHPTFKVLAKEEKYSPARELISGMMRFHEDADGNFIEQFQTTGFDSRLWELYLFATFNELGYARTPEVAVPDFLLSGIMGQIGVEATTTNPPKNGIIPRPTTRDEFIAYLQEYIPIKLARSLNRKLNRKNPYWDAPEMQDVPFLIAIQDFHCPGSMRLIVPAATEYVFGVRHSIHNGELRIERIQEHRYENFVEQSGFFQLPGAENVSAVMLNPQGTITKFNRMGYLAGFGNHRVQMVRTGIRRGEHDLENPMPKFFKQTVHDPSYTESWVEGMVVLHNPNARIAIDPILIPGACHEFLQPDGRIMSMLPDFHPYFSQTQIYLNDT
jgi:hypothetical protein